MISNQDFAVEFSEEDEDIEKELYSHSHQFKPNTDKDLERLRFIGFCLNQIKKVFQEKSVLYLDFEYHSKKPDVTQREIFIKNVYHLEYKEMTLTEEIVTVLEKSSFFPDTMIKI